MGEHEGKYSRRMSFGNVPHRTLHLLPLIRAQKEWPRQRDVQLFTHSPVPRVPHRVRTTPKRMRLRLHRHNDATAYPRRVQVPSVFRNAHGARDDASERGTAQCDRHVDVCGPLALDVGGCACAALVLGWVVWWDGGREVCCECGELALALRLWASRRWWSGLWLWGR